MESLCTLNASLNKKLQKRLERPRTRKLQIISYIVIYLCMCSKNVNGGLDAELALVALSY